MLGFLKHVVVVVVVPQSLHAGKMKASLAEWLKCFMRVGDIRVQAYPQPWKLTILFLLATFFQFNLPYIDVEKLRKSVVDAFFCSWRRS